MSIPKYPVYKESLVNWLGPVPSHWEVLRLKQACEVFPSNVDKHSRDDELPVLLCNYTDVYYNERITADMPFMAATASAAQIARFTLKGGDTIITKDSETADDIAIAAYVPEDLPGVVCGYHLSMVRPRASTCGAYVKRLFDSFYAKARFAVAANGLTRVGLGQYALDNVELPFPPPEEQRAIATFLDSETAKIDALVEEQRRLVELLNEELQCLVLASRFAEGTRELRLGNAANVMARPVVQKEGEAYRPLGMYNRGRGIFHKDPREMADMGDSDFFWVRSGDLVISGQFAWEGAVGLAGDEEDGCVVSHRYPVLRAKEGVALTEYLFALLLTKHGDFILNESSWGAAGRNRPLNLGLLLKVRVWVPTMQTQIKVARAVHQSKRLSAEMEIQLRLLHERRAALISAAVTGKIDVRSLASRTETVAA